MPFDDHGILPAADQVGNSTQYRCDRRFDPGLPAVEQYRIAHCNMDAFIIKFQFYGFRYVKFAAGFHQFGDRLLDLAVLQIGHLRYRKHLWFDDTDYKTKGTLIKWNPAIKTAFDRRALIESINNDKIDIIATDHAPHTAEEKNKPYTDAPSGGPLVQHSLVAMLELSKKGEITVEKIVEKMCHNPAIAFGINERGFIREGYKADLCLINPDHEWTVTKRNILYKCKWSPFENYKFSSSVEKTFVNGQIAYDRGQIKERVRGELLMFKQQL